MGGLRDRLESLPARRLQMYFHMFVVHIYYPMRKIYRRRYTEPPPPPQEPLASVRVEWQWKGLPKMWTFVTLYRGLSTLWMIYVVIKYSISSFLEWPVDLMGLPKPANCYLLGRFQLVDEVERVTAIFFASYHLIWRYFQHYRSNPINLSAVYFLILDDRDLAQYYKMLAREHQRARRQTYTFGQVEAGARAKATPATASEPPLASDPDDLNVLDEADDEIALPLEAPLLEETKGRERFLHEAMSYAVFRGGRRVNRLRPNRTPEASKRLRRFLVNADIIGVLIFVPIALGIAITLMLQVFNDKRYLAEYRGCDPGLGQMDERGELNKWSVHFRGHQMLAYMADFVENYFLWSESGIVCFFSPVLNLVINRDVVAYWEHLNAKIEATLAALRERQIQLAGPRQQFEREHVTSWPNLLPAPGDQQDSILRQARRFSVQVVPERRFEDDLEELVQDIQFEFQDFVRQIGQADHIIGELTSMLLTVWFTLFAFFTYTQQTQLMPALKATLICVGLILTALYLSVLRLHQYCLKTYPKVCSLMALDTSEHKTHFNEILDYYVRKRTCYKFYRRVPMTGIQYLTYVGWSLSCLFLVLNRR